jgi:hypothetical protein
MATTDTLVTPLGGTQEYEPAVVYACCPITGTVLELFELAATAPTELVAVTTHRTVPPASPETIVYEELVAPDIFDDTRCHWYVKVGAGEPDHIPVEQLRTDPTDTVPVITGGVILKGITPPPFPLRKL